MTTESNPELCENCGCVLPSPATDAPCPGCLLQNVLQPEASEHKDFLPTLDTDQKRPFAAPTIEELQKLVTDLEIIELIGCGGMGAVYQARQKDLDRLVAVKVLPRINDEIASAEQRFVREARALAKLNHPNIVSVYGFGKTERLYYFVMEYVPGVTLRDAIRNGQLTTAQSLDIISQLCDSLQYAHSEGIVHRDIKPENVLIDRQGRVRVADFGLAKLSGDSQPELNLTGTNQVMGTMRYMAPEQMAGATAVDHRADLYSLGVVFYELLTGELPIGWFAPPSRKSGVDVRLDEVVLRTLESEPSRRFQNASEIKSAVSQLLNSQPAEMPTETPPGNALNAVPSSGAADSRSSTSVEPAPHASARVYRLLDETETRNRRLFHGLSLVGMMAITMGLLLVFQFFLPRKEPASIPFLWLGLGALIAGFCLLIWSVAVKKRLRWVTHYKGHEILFSGGKMAEELYLDGGLVQRGGFGLKMEIRTTIRAGEGIGDEIVVLYDARWTYVRIRIFAEEHSK